MYVLTYHGDYIDVHYFSSLTNAIHYAASEIEDAFGEFNGNLQIARRFESNLNPYLQQLFDNDDTLQVIIVDQPEYDYRIYTIHYVSNSTIDPVYNKR